MAPGEPPPYPVTGTLDEMTDLYLQTVGLYGQCEDNKAELARALREIQETVGGE